MTKIFYIGLYIFISYILYGLFISQYDLSVTEPQIQEQQTQEYNDYRGVINVHSTLSTGTGTINEILNSANNENLDFLFFTELNSFPLPFNYNRYQDRVLSIIEAEYSYLNSRVILINQDQSNPIDNLGQANAMLSQYLNEPQSNKTFDSPFTILAHPAKKDYEWDKEKLPIGLDAIEIINLKSIWQNAWLEKKITFLWSFLIYPFNPKLAFLRIFQRAEKESKIWDKLNKDKLRFAFAGTDAQSKFNFFNTYLKFPSYDTLFGIVNNHILIKSELTKNYKKDRKKILNAVTKGQFYLSLDMIGDPKGFTFHAQKSRKIIPMGATIQLSKGTELIINIPENIKVPFEIELIKDGKTWRYLKNTKNKILIKEPGIYRCIVYVKVSLPIPEGRKWFPWIFSNPIQWTE